MVGHGLYTTWNSNLKTGPDRDRKRNLDTILTLLLTLSLLLNIFLYLTLFIPAASTTSSSSSSRRQHYSPLREIRLR